MRVYVQRKLNLVEVIDYKSPIFDENGLITYAGYVRFINHNRAECVMTYEQFHKTYEETQYE